MVDTNDTLISLLKDVRMRSGSTQEEVARAVNVSRQTIISIERGNYTPSVSLALRLAQYFNTSVEAIFTYE